MENDDDEMDWDLSEEQENELTRRIKDLEDTTRYMIMSTILNKMYYNISEDCWGSEISYGTKFKRKRHAKVVLRLNGDRKDKWHKIITVQDDKEKDLS